MSLSEYSIKVFITGHNSANADSTKELRTSYITGFPGGSDVKHLPAMQETQVQFLGRKDSLEKEMETHCSILAWKIPWMEVPGGLQSMGLQRVRT